MLPAPPWRPAYQRRARASNFAVTLCPLAPTPGTRIIKALSLTIAFLATLAALGWRGGAWRRGALAGVIAGLPPLIAPTLVIAASSGWYCAMCDQGPTMPCLLTCPATSSLVGHRAVTDASPRRFAIAAITSAALTGLLGCGTTGLGGAAGVVLGLVAGGVAGWIADPCRPRMTAARALRENRPHARASLAVTGTRGPAPARARCHLGTRSLVIG